MQHAYLVSTWSGAKLVETISSIPKGSRLLVVDGSQHGWTLSRQWNEGIRRLLDDEGYEAVVVMNDDVVLRADTGKLLAWALLEGQYQGVNGTNAVGWTDRELLLISARHASPSDACTDIVNWDLLQPAVPRWQPGPDFSCYVVGRKLFEKIGTFDENFNPAYFEDNDMHRRIQVAGYEAGAYAPYWHFRSSTVRYDLQRKQIIDGLFQKNREYYVEKWGGPPGAERYVVPFQR